MSSQNSAAANARLPGDWRALAGIIDHTNLRPEATPDQIIQLCNEAREFSFGAVMVHGCFVSLCGSQLQDSNVKVGAVVGFPLGANLTEVKRFEAEKALGLGAREIDMVINIGALKVGDREFVRADIRAVAETVHARGGLLKVILEMGLLNEDEKRLGCELSETAGADFVKTSTGFLGSGATVGDVALMRRTVKIGVKASGGIRSFEHAQAMIRAGATRLGTSSGVNIIRELRGS